MVVCGLSLATLLPVTVQAQTVSWTRQLGTSSNDISRSVATDSIGNVYISGRTEGSLGGANQGLDDVWVAKYTSNSALVWKKQLGTSSEEDSSGIATDSNSNVYISGDTSGSLGGAFQGGLADAWLAKYSSNGALMWKKQLGTSNLDYSNGVATDSKGNVYISGVIEGSLGGAFQGSDDAWVAKYNSAGALVWKKQLGTSTRDESLGVATDSNSNIYISGFTGSSLGGAFQGGFVDAWVAKYSQLN
jgi:Tfp pilus assembly protein PilZ